MIVKKGGGIQGYWSGHVACTCKSVDTSNEKHTCRHTSAIHWSLLTAYCKPLLKVSREVLNIDVILCAFKSSLLHTVLHTVAEVDEKTCEKINISHHYSHKHSQCCDSLTVNFPYRLPSRQRSGPTCRIPTGSWGRRWRKCWGREAWAEREPGGVTGEVTYSVISASG